MWRVSNLGLKLVPVVCVYLAVWCSVLWVMYHVRPKSHASSQTVTTAGLQTYAPKYVDVVVSFPVRGSEHPTGAKWPLRLPLHATITQTRLVSGVEAELSSVRFQHDDISQIHATLHAPSYPLAQAAPREIYPPSDTPHSFVAIVRTPDPSLGWQVFAVDHTQQTFTTRNINENNLIGEENTIPIETSPSNTVQDVRVCGRVAVVSTSQNVWVIRPPYTDAHKLPALATHAHLRCGGKASRTLHILSKPIEGTWHVSSSFDQGQTWDEAHATLEPGTQAAINEDVAVVNNNAWDLSNLSNHPFATDAGVHRVALSTRHLYAVNAQGRLQAYKRTDSALAWQGPSLLLPQFPSEGFTELWAAARSDAHVAHDVVLWVQNNVLMVWRDRHRLVLVAHVQLARSQQASLSPDGSAVCWVAPDGALRWNRFMPSHVMFRIQARYNDVEY